MNITRFRHVGLTVPDFGASRAFFKDVWGLTETAFTGGRSFLATQNGEPYQLVLSPGRERRLERIGFGVPGRADVESAHGELRAAGVRIVEEPHALSTPGGGYGFAFLDPDNRYVTISGDVALSAPGTKPAVPHILEHLVVNTPDIDRSTNFYTGVLGLRVSDWSEHQMSFLRCNSQHHVIAFNAAQYASYNHTAWGMASLDELFRGQGRLRAHGTEVKWGTGRHGPGEYVFSYFLEPSGFVVEYSADGLKIEDEHAWTPHVWERSPALMDTWGTAGAPSPEMRTAMAGIPDPGFQPLPA